MAEEKLLARAKRLDPDALTILHDRFYQSVYRYVVFKVGDQLVGDDLTAEVFLKLLENLKRGLGWRNTPKAWILGIARNVVADYYRQTYREKDTVLDEGIASSDSAKPDQQLMLAEKYLELAQALSTLTEEQREVVLLRFMEGLSLKEVASMLDKTVGAVKAMQFRAVHSLADKMPNYSSESMSVGKHG